MFPQAPNVYPGYREVMVGVDTQVINRNKMLFNRLFTLFGNACTKSLSGVLWHLWHRLMAGDLNVIDILCAYGIYSIIGYKLRGAKFL